MKDKQFTWADLKRAVNRIPEHLLHQKVTIWTDDEQCFVVSDIERLAEDYLFNGDEGCMPKSVLRQADPKDFKENRDEYYTVHPKGTRIINASI